MTELLGTSKNIKEINQAGFLNLYLDQLYIARFAREQLFAEEEAIIELQQLTSLFLNAENLKEILEEELYKKKYYKLNMRKIAGIMDKYRNDKNVYQSGGGTGNSELDKVWSKMVQMHKSDAQAVVKKINLTK